MQEILLQNFKEKASREYLGYRSVASYAEDPKTKRLVPTLDSNYTFLTFAQVEDKIKALGSGIESLGLAPVKA